MRIRLQTLTLQCRKSREVINFARQVTFLHGGIGAGKSSIARLIDYCLGASEFERTPAIRDELVSAELTAQIENYSVIFERGAQEHTAVKVTWRGPGQETGSVLAPLKTSSASTPIWGENVYNFSDLMFHLFGTTPIKVRKSKSDEDSPLIRLSFRDMLWYCYLEQSNLDSSFFRLKEPHVMLKSRDVMRFVVGYYTERLQDLEIALEKVVNDRATKLATSEQIKAFLLQFGYGTEADIQAELGEVSEELAKARTEQAKVRDSFSQDTHFVDQLRVKLREMSVRLGEEDQALADQQRRRTEYQSLKAELITARFKLVRMQTATEVLSKVTFERCPICGNPVDPPDPSDLSKCVLCHKPPFAPDQSQPPEQESIARDLESRIDELTESIERANRAYKRQQKKVEQLREEKAKVDKELTEELRDYDSAFVAQTRQVDKKIATLEERVRNLQRLRQMPEAIEKLLREADQLKADEERIRRELREERASLTGAHQVIKELQDTFLSSLLAVRMPGVKPDDEVLIDRRTWIPAILEDGNEEQTWDFYSTGSGGKKTLFNVCYALAVHKVAVERARPLPTLLIIDTPMKNIGEEVNQGVFHAFYSHLYNLVRGPLRDTQIIVIDKEYISPSPPDIELAERYMTPDQKKHPPLISYYRGP